MATKRLRIFAGPNGSGKSTIHKQLITKGDINFGIFVNADEIENLLKTAGRLDFAGLLTVYKRIYGIYNFTSGSGDLGGAGTFLFPHCG